MLAARTIAMRCSTARNEYIARCCPGPLVRPNHPSFVMLTINARAVVHELAEEVGEDDLVTDHDAERGAADPETRRHAEPGSRSAMNSAQPRTNPISSRERHVFSERNEVNLIILDPRSPVGQRETRCSGSGPDGPSTASMEPTSSGMPISPDSAASSRRAGRGRAARTIGAAVSGHRISGRPLARRLARQLLVDLEDLTRAEAGSNLMRLLDRRLDDRHRHLARAAAARRGARARSRVSRRAARRRWPARSARAATRAGAPARAALTATSTRETAWTPPSSAIWMTGSRRCCEYPSVPHGKPPSRWPRSHSPADPEKGRRGQRPRDRRRPAQPGHEPADDADVEAAVRRRAQRRQPRERPRDRAEGLEGVVEPAQQHEEEDRAVEPAPDERHPRRGPRARR